MIFPSVLLALIVSPARMRPEPMPAASAVSAHVGVIDAGTGSRPQLRIPGGHPEDGTAARFESRSVKALASPDSRFAGQQTDPRAEIINIRYHTHPNFTRIVLDIGVLREYSPGELRGPDRVYVDVLQARLNPILHDKAFPVRTEYLSQIRIGQRTASTVRVTVDLDFARVESYRIYHLFDPFRVVVDIYPKMGPAAAPGAETAGTPIDKAAGALPDKTGTPPDKAAASEKAPPPPEKTPAPLPSGYTIARQLGLGVRTVVLDPGHGGRHPGCVGQSGLLEKDVVLDISQRLRALLVEKAGLEVILTRESDIDVPLEDRTVVANQKRADLFISIHANAARNRKREGVETFFLNFSPDPDVNETAARENAASTRSMGQMKEILQKIVQTTKAFESRDLAEKIHRTLVAALGEKGRPAHSLGVKGGPFYVLIGGEMPSVLVEVSHLSNSREEGLLKTSAYRTRVAQGIYDGIMAYLQSLGKG